MSFPRYPAYKDSGVEWLGEVPGHWILAPLKYLAELNPRKSGFSGDTALLCSFVPMEKLKTGLLMLDEERPVAQVFDGYTYFEDGDILQAKVTPCFENKNVALANGLTNGVGFGSSEINVFRPAENVDAEYLYYRVQESAYMSFCTSSMAGAGGLKRVPTDVINSFTVAMPTLAEQIQIARFLNHETSKIDVLIQEQERLIELLKEKRQAVISHAVTIGLDPNAPMKDSGVEWLGEVPEHWQVVRIKNVAKLESGHTPSKDFPKYWDDGAIPWVSLNDTKQLKKVDYISDTQYKITQLGLENSSARLLPARSVVFTRDATIGLAAITTRDMAVSQHLIAWVCNDDIILPEFLLLVFYAMEYELNRFTFGATIKTIGMADVKCLQTTLPLVCEQRLIVEKVAKVRSKLDALVESAERASRFLVERRSALITAAVTGKIDVRGWHPPISRSHDSHQEDKSCLERI